MRTRISTKPASNKLMSIFIHIIFLIFANKVFLIIFQSYNAEAGRNCR